MRYSLVNATLTATMALWLLGPISATADVGVSIDDPFVFTDHFGPNQAGFATGQRLALGAFVSDPMGVPDNIDTVEAVALAPEEPDFMLPFLDIGEIFDGLYQVPLFTVPYTGQLGRWLITATNLQGETATATTHVLDKPRLIPLATGIQVVGGGTTPTVTWDPVFFDDDLNSGTANVEVDQYRVRLLNSSSDQFFRSAAFTTPSFTVPAGELTLGQSVFFRIEARHLDDGLENRSNTFTTLLVILDETNDACPVSNLDATVVIDGCDSGVSNASFVNGCTIADLIGNCARDASNHGGFVSCATQLTNDLKKDSIITGHEKGKIQHCAAQAAIP